MSYEIFFLIYGFIFAIEKEKIWERRKMMKNMVLIFSFLILLAGCNGSKQKTSEKKFRKEVKAINAKVVEKKTKDTKTKKYESNYIKAYVMNVMKAIMREYTEIDKKEFRKILKLLSYMLEKSLRKKTLKEIAIALGESKNRPKAGIYYKFDYKNDKNATKARNIKTSVDYALKMLQEELKKGKKYQAAIVFKLQNKDKKRIYVFGVQKGKLSIYELKKREEEVILENFRYYGVKMGKLISLELEL